MNGTDLLVSSRENWTTGRWSALRLLNEQDISSHPAKACLAVLIAASWLEINNKSNVKNFVSLALKWGCPKHVAAQFLVAGVYNTLGCAKAHQNHGLNPLPYFEQAVSVDGFSTLDKVTLAGLRMREQLNSKEAGRSFFYFPFLGSEVVNQKNSAVQLNILPNHKVSSKPYQLVVLGMHRSGTSCITNLLRNMGAYFGSKDASTGQNEENPRGFWERRDMRHITDKLLFSAGADWCDVANFDLEKIPKPIEKSAIQDFGYILDDLNKEPVWVLKEPRLCLLLPILRTCLAQPLAVCVHRNPLEVALSLQKRNGFTLAFGLALWEYYTVNMLKNTSDLNRIFISYNKVMENSIQSVNQIQQAFTTFDIPLKVPSKEKIPELVDTNLYRNKMVHQHMYGLLTVNQYNLFKYIESLSVDYSANFSDVNREALR